MKKDPKPEEITSKNIVLKDSVVRSKWFVGLVLTNFDEFGDLPYITFFKKGNIFSKLNKVLFCFMLINLLLIYLLSIVRMNFSDFTTVKFLNFFYVTLAHIPMGVDVVLKLALCCKSVHMKKRFNGKENFSQKNANEKTATGSVDDNADTHCKSPSEKSELEILSPFALPSFGNTRCCIFTKHPSFSQKRLRIKSISTNEEYFNISYKAGGNNKENEISASEEISPKKLFESKEINEVSEIVTDENDASALKVGKIFDKDKKSKFHVSNQPEEEETIGELFVNIQNQDEELARRTTNQIYRSALEQVHGSQDSREATFRDQIPSNPYISQNKSVVQRNTHMFIEDVYKAFSQHKFKTENAMTESQVHEPAPSKKPTNTFKEKALHISEFDKSIISRNNETLFEKIQNLNLIINLNLLSRNKNYNDATVNYLDSAIVKFGKLFKLRIEKVKTCPTSEIGYSIEACYDQQKILLEVIGIDEFENNLKIIIKDEYTQKTHLFIRCTKKYLNKHYIDNIQNKQNLHKILLSNDEKFLKSYFYLTKELDEEECELYSQLLTKLSDKMIDRNECFEQLMEKVNVPKAFQLHLVIGVKERLIKKPKIFEELRLNDMRLAYYTSEGYLEALGLANKFNLVDTNSKKSNMIVLNFEDSAAGHIAFKEAIGTFESINTKLFKQHTTKGSNVRSLSISRTRASKFIQPDLESADINMDIVIKDVNNKEINKLTSQRSNRMVIKLKESPISPDSRNHKIELFVSGKTLSLIMNDPYFYYHFKLILNFSSVIIAYKMNQEHRHLLTELVKNINEIGEVLCIGSGDKDSKMLKSGDFGIQMLTSTSLRYQANIALSKITDMSFLMHQEGKQLYLNCLKFIAFTTFCSSIWVAQAFVNEIKFKIISERFPNVFALLINHFAVWATGMFLIIFNKNLLSEKIVQYKILYLEHIYSSKNFGYLVLLQSCEAFALGLLIYLGLSYIISNTIIGITTKLIPVMLLTAIAIIIKSLLIINNRAYILLPIMVVGLAATISITYKLANDQSFIFGLFEMKNAFSSLTLWVIFAGLLFLIIHSMIMVHFTFDRYLMEPFLNIVNHVSKDKVFLSLDKIYDFVKTEYKPSKISHYIHKLFALPHLMDSSLASVLNPNEIFFDQISLNKLSLKINNPYLENNYILMNKYKSFKIDFRVVLIFCVIILTIFIGFVAPNNDSDKDLFKLFSTIIYFVILIISINVIFKQFRSNKIKLFAFSSVWIVLLINFFKSVNYVTIFALLFLYLTTYLEDVSFMLYVANTIGLIISYFTAYTVDMLVLQPFEGQTVNLIIMSIGYFFIFLSMITITSSSKYLRDRQKKKNFILSLSLQHKKNYNNELLNLLMPKFVLSRISYNVNETCLAEDAGQVAIVFVEICNFNEILKHHKENIILFLDQMFKDFDTECEKFGIQKIETVGKTYLASCGIKFIEEKLSKKLRSSPPMRRIFDFSLSMMKIAETYSYQDGKPIKLKIGINEGKCMMGVLGYHKPQFSLIGDTINTTSRLCSTGEDGHIMLSEEGFAIVNSTPLPSDLIIKPYLTYMKGKGDVPVIHVFKKENKLKALIISAITKFSQTLQNRGIKPTTPHPNNHHVTFNEFHKKESLKMQYSRSFSREDKKPISDSLGQLAQNCIFSDAEVKALLKLSKFGQRGNFLNILKYTHIIKNMMKLNVTNQKLLPNQKHVPESKNDATNIPKNKNSVKDNLAKQEINMNQKRNSLINSYSISNKLSSLNASNHSFPDEDIDGLENNDFEDSVVI